MQTWGLLNARTHWSSCMGAEDRYPRIQFDSQLDLSYTVQYPFLYKLHMHTYLLLAEACTDEKSCGITLFTALWGTHTDTHTLEISTCAQIVIRTHKHTKTAQLLIQDKCSNCIPWGPILSAPGYQNILQYHLSLWQPWKRRRCKWRRRDVLINDHH